jgi:ABC-type spermidine/putrescine transport system permease subunit I
MLGLALALGFAEAWYFTRRNPAATRSFAFTLALLPVITATVIMAGWALGSMMRK